MSETKILDKMRDAPVTTPDTSEPGQIEQQGGPSRAPRMLDRRLPVVQKAASGPPTGRGHRARISGVMQRALGNARVGRMASTRDRAPSIQRQATGKDKETPAGTDSGSRAGGASAAGATYVTADLKQKTTATVLAESADAVQAADIRWVYYTRIVAARGIAGLQGSSAYSEKSLWYRIWLYMLGDTTYGKDSLPNKKEFEGFSTIQAFCEGNGYMRTAGAKRAARVTTLVDDMFAKPAGNPYQGWIGQGNLDDFNNVSKPGSVYWKQARAYYWLQQQGKVRNTYVKVLPAGKKTQFVFDAKSIQAYFADHPLPDKVPLYEVGK